MANAGDRLQIVIGAKDELSAQLRDTRREMTKLARSANDMARRMEAGEDGLQDEYEQTRRDLQRLSGEYKQLQTRQSAVNREMKELTGNTRRAHSAQKNMSGGMGKMTALFGGITAAVAGATSAFFILGNAINEARTANKALAQTGAVLRSMGRTDRTAADIEKLLDQLSRASGIDDDALREMTNKMLTFGNVTGDTFDTANRLALDLSVAFGKDLNSASVMVGKALNDPVKGLTSLSRVGVSFTAQQQDQIKAMMEVGDLAGAQKIIIGELTKQVEGSAAAQADGIDKARVAWGNLREAVGDVLLSVGVGGDDLVKTLERMTKWIKDNKTEIVSVLQKIMSVVFKLISVFLKWQSIVLKAFGYIIGGVATLLQAMAWLDPSMQDAADKAKGLADGFGQASEQANNASKVFDDLSTRADVAARNSKQLADALKQVKSPKKIKLAIETVVKGFQNLGVGAPVDGALATGGPVMAGNTYLVGELGPEMFVPSVGSPHMVGANGPEIRDFHTSGTIIPHTMVNQFMAAQAAPVAAGGPSVVVEQLTVNDRWDAERELSALMRREARIRNERR
jgi:hypothetical protein